MAAQGKGRRYYFPDEEPEREYVIMWGETTAGLCRWCGYSLNNDDHRGRTWCPYKPI